METLTRLKHFYRRMADYGPALGTSAGDRQRYYREQSWRAQCGKTGNYREFERAMHRWLERKGV